MLVSLLCDYERVEAPKTSDDALEAARTDCEDSCLCEYGTSGLLRAVCLPWTRASLLGQGDEADPQDLADEQLARRDDGQQHLDDA